MKEKTIKCWNCGKTIIYTEENEYLTCDVIAGECVEYFVLHARIVV